MARSGKPPSNSTLLVVIAALIGVMWAVGQVAPPRESAASVARSVEPSRPKETYRLIHAIGNDEHESARGLSKAECEYQKGELKTVATALGTYNERAGYGSITCLPESLFAD